MINPSRRCAIYTRKSSEEGLDQSFNSLDAQREACAAYIQSQRHEGWRLLPANYDDGGFSGGTMERPALQRLLADIDAGAIDLVVVYKVDRLTRALSDFAKMVDRFDAKNVSFVSVTQSFNTTTSMGRLTLNVLLSFAQFEREVTGERIRDKIAASKQKGMWMGGLPPLGYDPRDRTLVINPREAEQVRHIYERYVVLQNVETLKRELRESGYRSKVREGRSSLFTNGALMRILTNPIYRGMIHHKGKFYPGQQPAIISEQLWENVQTIIARRSKANTAVPRARGRNPLLGLLTDEQGRAFYVSYTVKPGHPPYRYYVAKAADSNKKRLRLPAEELEAHVLLALQGYFANPQQVLRDLDVGESAKGLNDTVSAIRQLATPEGTPPWGTWRPMLKAIRYTESMLLISMDAATVSRRIEASAAEGAAIEFEYPMRMHRTGHDVRLVIPNETGEPEAAKRDQRLIKFIANGRKWYRQLTTGEEKTLKSIAATEGVTERYIARVMRGSLLAPDLLERILDGKQPVTLTVQRLMQDFPVDWVEQRHFFGV